LINNSLILRTNLESKISIPVGFIRSQLRKSTGHGGAGMNTPVIIKFPFWKAVERNKKAFYACINYGESACFLFEKPL
jgi:hypothetical protein